MAVDPKKPVKTTDGREIKGLFEEGTSLYGFVRESVKLLSVVWGTATGKVIPELSFSGATSPEWDIENVADHFDVYVNVYQKATGKVFFGSPVDSADQAVAQVGGTPPISRLAVSFDAGRFDP